MRRLAQELVAELIEQGGQTIAIEGDLSDPCSCEKMVNEAQTSFGLLSIAVANAAASSRSPWNEITIGDGDTIQNVNLRGTSLLAKALFNDLKKNQGSFISVTSVMG
jgi:NAD(P)-dependent dehydrogenase (short-subunit alcohol dehydrogenase family)